jgi:hypothetical protein
VKNYLIGGLICLVAALVFGFKPVQRVINEATNRGTVRGVETCMDYLKSELLSRDTVKTTCVQAFHNPLYIPELVMGQAGPRMDQGKVNWGGTLENKTPDHVTTWIRIAVTIFDTDGTKQEVFAETPIWKDPLGEVEFRVELPDLEPKQFDDIEFCDKDDKAPKACMAWVVTDVMGLTI